MLIFNDFGKYMARSLAEWSNRFSIFWLKKYGYLNNDYCYHSGSIKWTYGSDDRGSSIGFSITAENNNSKNKKYITLNYTHTDRFTGNINEMEYNVNFTTTPCHFGGNRYWFICPLTTNDNYCGKRVGVIYITGKYFGCRHCGNIAYADQNENKRLRSINNATIPDMENLERQIRRKFYNNKPTKKYLKLMKMSYKLRNAFINFSIYMNKKRNKIDEKNK